jgi:DNA polymerase III alpha subunit (gram-positive type)
MKDIMIDLETMGVGPNAAIIQIGAAFFDRETGVVGRAFKVNIDLDSSIKSGGIVDGETVRWWLNQICDAQESITEQPNVSMVQALCKFLDFIGDDYIIWSHATFDFVILNNAMKRCDVSPMHYRSACDIRTLVDLSNIKVQDYKREGIHHDALDDCVFQIKYCVDAMNILRKRKV